MLKVVIKMNDSPIVKCSHCNQIFLNEDFGKHECSWILKDVKRISVLKVRDDSYKNQTIIRGYGIDGTVYTFVVSPRTAIPFIVSSSDEILQHQKSDKDFTEPR